MYINISYLIYKLCFHRKGNLGNPVTNEHIFVIYNAMVKKCKTYNWQKFHFINITSFYFS